MFISQLKDKLVAYDKYGIHWTNGFKALFLLELMLVVELCSSIKNPYFYYFFVPINCLNAEIIGNTIKEKYLFLIFSLLGSSISIFLFGVFSVYKTFFVFFVFFYSAAIYTIFIHKLKNMLAVVPIILGLASYSLIYVGTDSNFYIALNHFLETMAASGVILAGLYVFPKTYYLAIWRRAFSDVITQLELICAAICRGEVKTIGVVSGIIIMERYSKMLPRGKKSHSILKMTLLTFQLVVSMSYLITFEHQIPLGYIKALHGYIAKLCEAIKNHKPIIITEQELPVFRTTHELWVLYKLILSWNHLCEK